MKSENKIYFLIIFMLTLPIMYIILSGFTDKLSIENVLTNIRVGGYLKYLRDISPPDFIVGIGFGNFQEYMNSKGISVYNYSNSILYSLFSFGVIGLLIILGLIIEFFKVNKDKGIFIILLFSLATDISLFGPIFIYLIVIIYVFKKYEVEKGEINND